MVAVPPTSDPGVVTSAGQGAAQLAEFDQSPEETLQ